MQTLCPKAAAVEKNAAAPDEAKSPRKATKSSNKNLNANVKSAFLLLGGASVEVETYLTAT